MNCRIRFRSRTKRLVLPATVLLLCIAVPHARAEQDFHTHTVETIDGRTISLETYKGKALLVVNTASRCGFTPQYAAMQKLYEDYKDRGFEVLAFPSNDFMNQEPGTNEEIQAFCTLKFNTTFPLFAKIAVKGSAMHPLYAYLTRQPGHEGDISWNFNKFLVSPEGRVVARFGSRVVPTDERVIEALESILPEKSL